MKLAEALLLRAEMQNKLASLRERLTNNVVVQSGEKPHEKPDDLLRSAAGLIADRAALVQRINRTNQDATAADGRPVARLLADRDAIAAKHALVRSAIEATRKEPDRYSLSEIKWKSVIDVKAMQKQLDDLSANLRQINAILQQTNWQIDLIEEQP